MIGRRTFLGYGGAAAALQALPVAAQERFSLFVGSNPENVERMVTLAGLRAGETVMDLGAGDGRIVFAALKAVAGVRGVGVDIDANLVAKATEAAKAAGLADRVSFLHQNVFDADLSQVDVIFMWLFPELMRLLRPKILKEAKPGARIVAATWDFGSWPADGSDDRGGGQPAIRKWVVPARIEGGWEWEATIRGRTHQFVAVLDQRMQSIEGIVRVAHRREVMQYTILRGDMLNFTLRMTLPETGYANLTFVGRVAGDRIEGRINAQLPKRGEDAEGMDEYDLPWRATRADTRSYFAPTGTNVR